MNESELMKRWREARDRVRLEKEHETRSAVERAALSDMRAAAAQPENEKPRVTGALEPTFL